MHITKSYRGSHVNELILSFRTLRELSASTPAHLTLEEKNREYQLNERLDWPQLVWMLLRRDKPLASARSLIVISRSSILYPNYLNEHYQPECQRNKSKLLSQDKNVINSQRSCFASYFDIKLPVEQGVSRLRELAL